MIKDEFPLQSLRARLSDVPWKCTKHLEMVSRRLFTSVLWRNEMNLQGVEFSKRSMKCEIKMYKGEQIAQGGLIFLLKAR